MRRKSMFFFLILSALIAFGSCTTETTIKPPVTLKITSNTVIVQGVVGNPYEFVFVVNFGDETWASLDDHQNSEAVWTFDNFVFNSAPVGVGPSGLVFEDGTIIGTPDQADLGWWSFDVTVEKQVKKKEYVFKKTYYLVITNPLEIITNPQLGSTIVDEYFTTSFSAIFGTTPYYWYIGNYELNSVPQPNGFNGLTFQSTGKLLGTPIHQDIGIWTFDVTVFDSSVPNQQNDTVNFTLEVKESLTVPTYYATIQDAIDAANNGDVVKVLAGVYQGVGNRNLTFRGKKIKVRGNVNDPSQVVIDCEGSSSNMHRGFIFNNKETLDSVVEGFTVKNAFHTVGGAVAIERNAAATFRNMIFENNKAEAAAHVWGGVIYVNQSAEIAIYDSILRNNEAKITPGNSFYVYGGIINAENGANVYMEGCTFENNTTTAWYTRGLFRFNYSNATMINCVIDNNTITSTNSTHFGMFDMTYASMDMDNTIISNNAAIGTTTTHYGLIGYVIYSTWQMKNSKIINNRASNTSTNFGLLGYFCCSTLTIEDSIISGNEISATGTHYGFGYFYNGSLTFKNSSFSNNKITNTSTTYGSYIYYSTVDIDNSTFSGNVTTGSTVYGGVMLFGYSTVKINASSFINNQNNATSTGHGGALEFLYTYSGSVITNSVFAYNSTRSFGGAINMRGAASTFLDIINTTIYKNNSTANFGGGIYVVGTLRLFNSILWDNNAAGGLGHQIFHSSGSTTMQYTCYRNQANDMYNVPIGTGCITTDPLFVDTGTNAVTGTVTFTQDSMTVTGQSTQFLTEIAPGDGIMLDADGQTFATTVRRIISNTELELDGPYKGAAAAPGAATVIKVDLRLQTGSPCIDAGSNALIPSGITTDRDGNNRTVGTVDMGAYEVQ